MVLPLTAYISKVSLYGTIDIGFSEAIQVFNIFSIQSQVMDVQMTKIGPNLLEGWSIMELRENGLKIQISLKMEYDMTGSNNQIMVRFLN